MLAKECISPSVFTPSHWGVQFSLKFVSCSLCAVWNVCTCIRACRYFNCRNFMWVPAPCPCGSCATVSVAICTISHEKLGGSQGISLPAKLSVEPVAQALHCFLQWCGIAAKLACSSAWVTSYALLTVPMVYQCITATHVWKHSNTDLWYWGSRFMISPDTLQWWEKASSLAAISWQYGSQVNQMYIADHLQSIVVHGFPGFSGYANTCTSSGYEATFSPPT